MSYVFVMVETNNQIETNNAQIYKDRLPEKEDRHRRGFNFCDPTQPNPVANGPNPTHETSLQNNPTQPTKEDRSHNHHT